MADLRFDPRADDFLTELEADLETNEVLLGKLNSALDRLETNPGDAWCRRRRFQNIGVWGIAVTHKGREWLILWEQLNDDVVMIQAITPAP